jgi:hypothetical protein
MAKPMPAKGSFDYDIVLGSLDQAIARKMSVVCVFPLMEDAIREVVAKTIMFYFEKEVARYAPKDKETLESVLIELGVDPYTPRQYEALVQRIRVMVVPRPATAQGGPASPATSKWGYTHHFADTAGSNYNVSATSVLVEMPLEGPSMELLGRLVHEAIHVGQVIFARFPKERLSIAGNPDKALRAEQEVQELLPKAIRHLSKVLNVQLLHAISQGAIEGYQATQAFLLSQKS